MADKPLPDEIKEKDSTRTITLREKRGLYTCGPNYVTLDQIPTWNDQLQTLGDENIEESNYEADPILNEKISLWEGDITRLEVDAIVNSCSAKLMSRPGLPTVYNAIHAAAGPMLMTECLSLRVGYDAVTVTGGYNLPAKYVIHAPGPVDVDEVILQLRYSQCFQLILDYGFRTVAFCCIATGIYEFPKQKAARIALGTAHRWLLKHSQKVDRIIFCVFDQKNKSVYTKLLPFYFPPIHDYMADEKLFQQALEKGYVVSSTVVLLLIGVAGAGKTSFCHLVFNESPPLIRSSTPVAEPSIRAVSLTKARMSEKDEVTIWERVPSVKLTNLVADGIKTFQTLGLVEESLVTNNLLNSDKEVNSSVDGQSADIQQSDEESIMKRQPVAYDSKVNPLSSDVRKLFEMDHIKQLLKLVPKSEGTGEILKCKWLYVIDSGGQPQFHELLPTFVHHVSAAAFFVKLNEELKSYPQISYYKDGVLCGRSYKSSSNHLQTLQNCLQAMQSRNDDSLCPKLLFVGTHRDLENKKEPLKSKNKKLLEMLYQNDIFRHNLVFFSIGKSDQLLFPMNAKNPSQADMKVVADFRSVLVDSCSQQQHKIPINWFVLEQLLQDLSKDGVLGFDKCLEVAQLLRMNTEQLQAALAYFVKLNIFQYYPNILPKVVFTTPQVLLSKITELVEYSHDLNSVSCRQVDSTDFEFREYGKISINMLKRRRFSGYYVDGIFEAEDLLYLWIELLVVAKTRDGTIIMPAVLSELSLKKFSAHRLNIKSSKVMPIAVHYPDGLFPLGIFSSLISYLQSKSKWKISTEDGKPVCLFKNCVEFTVDNDVTANVTLIYSHNWIELHADVFSEIHSQMAFSLLNTLFKGINSAQKVQRYSSLVPELAFFCKCKAGNQYGSSLHLASPVTPDNKFMRCRKNERLCIGLTGRHQLWLKFLDAPYSLFERHSSTCAYDSQDKGCAGTERPSLTSKPRLYELDRIKIDGKTVKVISRVAASWEKVAIRLHFECHEIRSISRDKQLTVVDACREVFTQWLEGKGRTPTTWRTVIEALEEADFSEVTNDLKEIIGI